MQNNAVVTRSDCSGGEDRLVDLEGIVDLYEMLYRQPKRAWTHERDVRSFNEVF